MSAPVEFERVREAAAALAGVAHRTPVMTSRTLDARCGCRIFLKCETFQRMGAFKFRGAYHAMNRLSPDRKARGVLTYSSGNHAQAVALAGRLLGVPATIVMPQDAPSVKRAATQAYGAEIVGYDRAADEREAVARRLLETRGLTLIPPFDHPDVVAGQGTAALELIEEAGPLDALLVPCGGGGLLSGSALSARALLPDCWIAGVEPEAGDDAKRSFESGRLQRVKNPDTIADGARTSSLSPLTFALIQRNVDAVWTASDAELVEAMRFLWERLKLVVEPTGALGLAPLHAGRLGLRGKRVGVILSGGNVDLLSALDHFRRADAARRAYAS